MTSKFELVNHSIPTCFKPIWPFHDNDKMYIIDSVYSILFDLYEKNNIITKCISEEKTRHELTVKIVIIIHSE